MCELDYYDEQDGNEPMCPYCMGVASETEIYDGELYYKCHRHGRTEPVEPEQPDRLDLIIELLRQVLSKLESTEVGTKS